MLLFLVGFSFWGVEWGGLAAVTATSFFLFLLRMQLRIAGSWR
jgi:hypothetical protein